MQTLLGLVNFLLLGIALGGAVRLFVVLYPGVRREDFVLTLVVIWLALCALGDAHGAGADAILAAGIGVAAGLLAGEWIVAINASAVA